MATRPSSCEESGEDRERLRRREWERRNQEAQQEQKLYQNTPLFGEPYKTNKGDELSSRIQRMLGNYEDVSQPDGGPKEPPAPVPCGRPGRQTHSDKPKPPFQNLSPNGRSQPSQSRHRTPQSQKRPPAPEHPPPAPPSYSHQDPTQKKDDPWPDCPPLPPALSPPVDPPLSPLHSSDASDSEHPDTDERDSPPQHQGGATTKVPTTITTSCTSSGCGEAPHHPEPQREHAGLGTEATPLASQSYPLPLASKPSQAMSQKPTAYVRPMDGPDQAHSESPDLKPSPDFHGQSYENLPDLKHGGSKSGLPPLKIPPQAMESLSNEVHSVEEILREMTHFWPPLLTAIHTPSTAEASKFCFPSKELHAHPEYPIPKLHDPCKAPASPCQQDSVVSRDGSAPRTAPSSGGESASSSESEGSSGSESDSESGAEEPPAPRNNPVTAKVDGPAVNEWQLGRWMPANQQSLTSESQGDIIIPSPASKPQLHTEYYNSQTPPAPPSFSHTDAKPAGLSQHGRPKSPVSTEAEEGQRQTVGIKHPGKPSKAPRSDDTQTRLQVESVEVTPRDPNSTFTHRPKVKTKSGSGKTSSSSSSSAKKPEQRSSSEKQKGKEVTPKVTVTLANQREPSDSTPAVSLPIKPPTGSTIRAPVKGPKAHRSRSPGRDRKREAEAKPKREAPRSLLVKIHLNLLSRVPQAPRPAKAPAVGPTGQPTGQNAGHSKKPSQEKGEGITSTSHRKRPADAAMKDERSVLRKKPKMEKESKPSSSSPTRSTCKTDAPKSTGEEKEKRKMNKAHPSLSQASAQEPGKEVGHKRRPQEAPEGGAASKSSNSSAKHKKSSKRHEHAKTGKKSREGDPVEAEVAPPPAPAHAQRPLLTFQGRLHSVEHHMKEAKKLKHKADATSDKMGKALNYLDAAMSFVESGVAMEADPQTPKSAYTMFSETLDLIRFILKLKNYLDILAPATERDFLVLCMKCQSLLQMAMFRFKRDSALKYSRTLTDYFKSSAKSVQTPSPCLSKGTGTPSPLSPLPSPAGGSNPSSSSSSSSSGASASASTVAIPQLVQQVASSYVSITSLFLSAQDTWEQAEELATRGSGLLSQLDSAMGQLSLTSSMSTLVRYTRQGLHWLRLDTR